MPATRTAVARNTRAMPTAPRRIAFCADPPSDVTITLGRTVDITSSRSLVGLALRAGCVVGGMTSSGGDFVEVTEKKE